MNNRPMLPAILRSMHAALLRVEKDLAVIGLSLPKLVALQILSEADEPMSLGQLAARASCAKSNVTQMVDRLEADGFVKRVADPADRRSKRAALTRAGREACVQGTAVQEKSDKALFGPLTAEERRHLMTLMKKLEGEAE